jgi:hypothetical protein
MQQHASPGIWQFPGNLAATLLNYPNAAGKVPKKKQNVAFATADDAQSPLADRSGGSARMPERFALVRSHLPRPTGRTGRRSDRSRVMGRGRDIHDALQSIFQSVRRIDPH